MIIDKDQLTKLLMDKSGLEQEEVEAQLSELIKRVNQAAEEGKSFSIEGFGTFSMEEGALHFEPVDLLETEINNKYAGMKPIEMIGAFRQPEGEDIPEMSDISEESQETAWSFDEDAVKKEKLEAEESPEPPEETVDPVPADDESQEAREEFEKSVAEDQPPESPIEKKSKTGEGATSKEPGNKKKGRKEEPDVLGRVLVAAVIVIAVGVSGFMAYDMGWFTDNRLTQPNVNQSEPVGQPKQGQATGNNRAASSLSEETEPAPPAKVQGTEGEQISPSEQKATPYGLKGEVNSNIGSGYTIVVHSLRSREKAVENKKALEKQGYRALISQADVQGVTYYRVGIGQFKTVEDAQAAIDDIPEQFHGNNFIKRI